MVKTSFNANRCTLCNRKDSKFDILLIKVSLNVHSKFKNKIKTYRYSLFCSIIPMKKVVETQKGINHL